MPERIFVRGDILVPRGVDMEKWSVIACDQFTAQPEYWRRVEEIAGSSLSTLRLMLPEAYLETCDVESETGKIADNMRRYLEQGVFDIVKQSYIYVERQLSGGSIRRGMMGLLDLEHYDYTEESNTLIHATEGTVRDRLPPRVSVRRSAALEMPHVVVFIDDPDYTVIDPVIYMQRNPEKLYDFELMQGGGHVTGWRISDENADSVEKALIALEDRDLLEKKYGIPDRPPIVYAVGDGNHSLAAARLCWEEIRKTLTAEQRIGHPSRYSLVELVNIHDSSIEFEPIHRVLFETDNRRFIHAAGEFFAPYAGGKGDTHEVEFLASGQSHRIRLGGLTIARVISLCEDFITGYAANNGGRIDYIHDSAAAELGAEPGNAAIILPAMKKSELFPSIIRSGAFPRKSFSIGHALDKRYYLECRRLY